MTKLLLALALAIAACSGSDATETSDIDPDMAEAIDTARDEYPLLDDVTDEQLARLGDGFCSSLSAGADVEAALDLVADNFDTITERRAVAYFLGSVIVTTCPENTP